MTGLGTDLSNKVIIFAAVEGWSPPGGWEKRNGEVVEVELDMTVVF